MKRQENRETIHRVYLVFFFLILLVVLVRSAWICDDAYITLRTVDNLYHGYGLTWNVGERLQSYTHPLWLGVLAATYFLVANPYYLLIALTISITGAAMYLTVSRLAPTPASALLGLLMLMASRAFIDFSTAGLENPLSHLLLVAFMILFLKGPQSKASMFFLSLTAALGMLNRMDLLLVFLPAMLYALYRGHSRQDLLYFALGLTPFIAWELFSLFYYGFPFPNTAYAKLNTGIPASLLVKQGLLFLLNSISRDPFTLTAYAAGLLITFLEKDLRRLLLALGFTLYLAYIVRVGGDYMSGRFLSVIAFGSAALLASLEGLSQKQTFRVTLIAIVLLSLATPTPPLLYNAGDAREEPGPMGIYNGIEDGRTFNYQQTGLLTVSLDKPMPKLGWAYEGREAREREYAVVDRGAAGAFGYYAGPSVHVVDWYGIGDPLLSRLPVDDPLHWRIGHFNRSIPEGYLETLESGELMIQDLNLAEYYQKLVIVTQGDLFNTTRLIEIWRLNTGYYQPLLDAYQASINK